MTDELLKNLPNYKMAHTHTVQWGDMDAMRHVNNTRYFYFCESVRIRFLTTIFPDIGRVDPDQLEEGIALAQTGCRYKAPVTFPDQLIIGTAVTDIGETDFTMQHALYSTKLGFVAAEATAHMVFYDFSQGRRKSLTEEMVQVLEGYRLGSDA